MLYWLLWVSTSYFRASNFVGMVASLDIGWSMVGG